MKLLEEFTKQELQEWLANYIIILDALVKASTILVDTAGEDLIKINPKHEATINKMATFIDEYNAWKEKLKNKT